jgi:Na+/proline symporter
MHPIDWLIVVGYLVWIVYDGLKRTRNSAEVEGYFLANRSLPWWAVGLTVMATQLSAVTLVGGTGQGYADGMRFIQFYFGLPLAMVILSLTVVPLFYRARVYTAYEYLERRFDSKTRTLASFLFLLSRGLQCGTIISAPAVILAIVMGWNLAGTVVLLALPTVLFTMFGGVQAVTWTDVKQMVVIVAGVVAAVGFLIVRLAGEVSLGSALYIAGATGRMQAIDFRPDLRETYTFWSGLIGGLFLMLSYFGCDQSQVQRYLTARSVDEGRHSLLMSAFVKIPLQTLILLTGVLVFVFYLFTRPPMLFNRVHEDRVRASTRAPEYDTLEREFGQAFDERREAARAYAAARAGGISDQTAPARAAFVESNARLNAVRARARKLVQDVSGDPKYSDVNFVFPTFVTAHLPIGLVGLIIAAIFAAATSSIAAELNSLATSTVIDFYKRHFRTEAPERHFLFVSKIATGVWGVLASLVALYAASLGSLIEVVNFFGSFFYGSLLGVFILAFGVPRATGRGAFWGLVVGMGAVLVVAWWASLLPFQDDSKRTLSFLWLNVVGATMVVAVGFLVSLSDKRPG